jgi:hypothetical protein
MLKGEAEQMIRRVCEDQKREMDDKEIEFLAEVVLKIASRIVEEAVTNMSSNRPGGKPGFYA